MIRKSVDRIPEGVTLAGLGDVPELKALARRSYKIYVPVMNAIPLPMSADYGVCVRRGEVWIVREGRQLSASLTLARMPDHLLIESIAVDPQHQGNGHGRFLLDWALRRAEMLSHDTVKLYTNVHMAENRRWYRRSGFEETGQEQRGDKIVVHMAYRLRPTP